MPLWGHHVFIQMNRQERTGLGRFRIQIKSSHARGRVGSSSSQQQRRQEQQQQPNNQTVYGSEREEEDGGGNGRRTTAKIVTTVVLNRHIALAVARPESGADGVDS